MNENDQYIGKHLLLGLNYSNEAGEIVRREQLHGTITRITDEGIFIERADGSGEVSLPPALESLHPATAREYTLNTTGEVVVDPDYVSVWTINETQKSED
jgi:hypothetical protein